MIPVASNLLLRTRCPHCWNDFAPEDVLWISAHTDLVGDPLLGPEKPQRFLPTRFTVDGSALDAKGHVCDSLACPKCHLPVPQSILEMAPEFISIMGTPSCGKSYYLAAMTWELRRLLPLHFALAFTDADTVSNRLLNEYEASLFLNRQADELVPMADLMQKTAEQGATWYTEVNFGNQVVKFPRPFMFALQALENHPRYAQLQRLSRVVCLYDNAGESFAAGKDSPSNPVTKHLAQSRVLLFLFDPLQDPRFRSLCKDRGITAPGLAQLEASRQESVLLEASARIRRHGNLPSNAKLDRLLVVIVTKADVWSGLLKDIDWRDPWAAAEGTAGLDNERIEKLSRSLRMLLLQVCPEMVTAAESFVQNVIFVPVSALGVSPQWLGGTPTNNPKDIMNRGAGGNTTAVLGMRPRDIRPLGVATPILYGIQRTMTGLMPRIKRRTKAPMPS